MVEQINKEVRYWAKSNLGVLSIEPETTLMNGEMIDVVHVWGNDAIVGVRRNSLVEIPKQEAIELFTRALELLQDD